MVISLKAKIQPIAHISTAGVYSLQSKRFSGDRYGSVAIFGEYGLFAIEYVLANPKSAILRTSTLI